MFSNTYADDLIAAMCDDLHICHYSACPDLYKSSLTAYGDSVCVCVYLHRILTPYFLNKEIHFNPACPNRANHLNGLVD